MWKREIFNEYNEWKALHSRVQLLKIIVNRDGNFLVCLLTSLLVLFDGDFVDLKANNQKQKEKWWLLIRLI